MELATVQTTQDCFLPFSCTGIVPLHSTLRRCIALFICLWTTLGFGLGIQEFFFRKSVINPS